jgi:hypothetical protein
LKYQPDLSLAQPDKRFFTEISGLMNVTACTAVGPTGNAAAAAGPPVYLSMPHFCHADPSVAAMTEGTRCNESRHDLWLGVEPLTGITMAAAKRLQVSSELDARFPTFDANVAHTILPIFWAEELAEVSEKYATAFRSGGAPVRSSPATVVVGALGHSAGTASPERVRRQVHKCFNMLGVTSGKHAQDT